MTDSLSVWETWQGQAVPAESPASGAAWLDVVLAADSAPVVQPHDRQAISPQHWLDLCA